MEPYFKDIVLEAFAMASLARQHDVCHELHFHGYLSRALTFLTSSAFGVEREKLRRKSHLLCQRISHQVADSVGGLDIGGRIRPRALSYGILVNKFDVFYRVDVATYATVFSRCVANLSNVPFQCGVEYAFYKARLSRTANSRHHGHHV